MRHHYRRHKKPNQTVDRVMDVVAVVSPLLGVPQAVQIFTEQDATGVSLFSWVAFAAVAIVFLVVLKNTLTALVGFLGLLLLVFILLIATHLYKKMREKGSKK